MHICSKCLTSDEYAKGSTKVFLRNGLLEKLTALVNGVYASMATRLQSRQRTNKAKRGFAATKLSTVKLQNLQRMLKKKREFGKQKVRSGEEARFLNGCHF